MIAVTLAALAYEAYNYMSKPSNPSASAPPLGEEGNASRLFCAVGEDTTEILHTIPDRLPASLQRLSDQWAAEENARLAESGRTISSPRPSQLVVRA